MSDKTNINSINSFSGEPITSFDNYSLVEDLKKIKGFKNQIKFYNDKIRSLAFWHYNDYCAEFNWKYQNPEEKNANCYRVLMIYGYDQNLLYKEGFANADTTKINTIKSIRENEIDRIKSGINSIEEVEEKLDWLFSNVAGMRFNNLYEKQYTYDFFYRKENEYIEDGLFYIIGDRRNYSYEEIGRIHEHVKFWIWEKYNPAKANVYKDEYNGFDSKIAISKFKEELENITFNDLKDRKFKNEINAIESNFESSRYFQMLLSGQKFDYSSLSLNDGGFQSILTHIALDEIFNYYNWLKNKNVTNLSLNSDNKQIKKTSNSLVNSCYNLSAIQENFIKSYEQEIGGINEIKKMPDIQVAGFIYFLKSKDISLFPDKNDKTNIEKMNDFSIGRYGKDIKTSLANTKDKKNGRKKYISKFEKFFNKKGG